jgi:hypothetical protein
MFNDIWLHRKLPKPPGNFDHEFFNWLEEVGKQLEVRFFDNTPMPLKDFEQLKLAFGNPHAELECFYSKCTPWGSPKAGIEIWNQHNQLIYQHTRQKLLSRGELASADIESALAVAPALWPINLSQNASAVAFSDSQGRLAILNGNIGENLGCPLAMGLRNFMIMTVIGEIIWEEKNYQTYADVLDDVMVRAAGLWPYDNPPCHPVIDAWETTKLSGHQRKMSLITSQ